MHERNLIKSISFIINDRRVRFDGDGYGRFEVFQREPRQGKNIFIGTKTATEIINWVVAGDPVLTLKDGDKIRVCQGGSTQIRVEALCLIESHDKYFLGKQKLGRF